MLSAVIFFSFSLPLLKPILAATNASYLPAFAVSLLMPSQPDYFIPVPNEPQFPHQKNSWVIPSGLIIQGMISWWPISGSWIA
jgi:hypothetical protein